MEFYVYATLLVIWDNEIYITQRTPSITQATWDNASKYYPNFIERTPKMRQKVNTYYIVVCLTYKNK